MKQNRGFTLVELLVVMAIIAILASIVVPNVQRYIVRARVTRAVAELNGMELSLTAITTDAGRANFGQMFKKNAVREPVGSDSPDSLPATIAAAQGAFPDDIIQIGWPADMSNPNAFNYETFERAANVYARVVYDLLRLGRDSLATDDSIAPLYIDRDVLAKLGTNYMDIGLDPWGQVYRAWPGPWRFSTVGADPGKRWPIPFRIFSIDMSNTDSASRFTVKPDGYEFSPQEEMLYAIEDAATWPSEVNRPAQPNKPAFLWSYGGNSRSSQMLYQAAYGPDKNDWFYPESEEDIAGGDDVNNWDNGGSWQRFYQ
ncbi:MAG: prepilin-type N-terminal cleavage/methylation domain-containing protein [Candidatus Hydrogenedens sp.]|nr:prepilin-type N-terminal cleavage/methylation domain-containing protein [Candidatus Hydrogenedens sp.]